MGSIADLCRPDGNRAKAAAVENIEDIAGSAPMKGPDDLYFLDPFAGPLDLGGGLADGPVFLEDNKEEIPSLMGFQASPVVILTRSLPQVDGKNLRLSRDVEGQLAGDLIPIANNGRGLFSSPFVEQIGRAHV